FCSAFAVLSFFLARQHTREILIPGCPLIIPASYQHGRRSPSIRIRHAAEFVGRRCTSEELIGAYTSRTTRLLPSPRQTDFRSDVQFLRSIRPGPDIPQKSQRIGSQLQLPTDGLSVSTWANGVALWFGLIQMG